jgi:HlyD family secretion protein
MKKRVVISAGVLLVLAVASYGLFWRGASAKYSFRFDRVSSGDLTVFVTATGTINPVISVDVGTQVSGIVSNLYADFNSVVRQGQVIARIDTTFLEQSVKDAEASLDRAIAQEADSKRNYDREKALLEKKLDSQLNYDAALTTYESNKAATKSAQATLDRAKINLAYATIYAPISGVVINRAVNVGQTVAASFSSPTLYTIANDLSKMQVLTTVDESDIGRISVGQEATFTVDAYPDETFRGVISQIRLNPVAIQNVVNYTVVVDVKNDKFKLMPGMTANVKIQVADAHNALLLPNMALRFRPPAELVDSAGIAARRSAFAGRRRGADSVEATSRGTGGSGIEQVRSSEPGGSSMTRPDGLASREQTRDGLQNALMQKKAAQPFTLQMKSAPGGAQFGIDIRFPEFEKSAYVPSHEDGRARVWVLNAQGKLEPVFVRTGVTDGRLTEITSRTLKAGDQVVLGATAEGDDASTASPLFGGGVGQRRGGPGGFR